MRYALFLGCTAPTKSRNYELATREVARALGIELVDLPDFECCGFPLKSVHHESHLLMAARNLMVAEREELDVCVLCSACTGTLTEVNRQLAHNDVLREQVVSKLGGGKGEYVFGSAIAVKHVVRILHYGCHYLRPSEIYDDCEDPEDPHSLDELIEVTGAKSVRYSERERCCGAGVLAIDEEIALSLAQKKLEDVRSSGAHAMVLMCPFCGVMYDENQARIEARSDATYNLPVLYYPQLLGIALGIDPKSLGFRLNRVKADKFLERVI